MRRLFTLLGNGIALLAAFGLLARFISPATWWPPAIVTLLLPGLLLLTFLFAGWKIYRRKPLAALFPAMVCLLALPLITRLFAFGTLPDPATTEESVTVATSNVRGFKNGAWESMSEDRIWRRITSLDADLLLLQEAPPPHRGKSTAELIRDTETYGGHHQPEDKTIATYAGEVTPVSASFSSINDYNGFLVTDVTTELGPLRVINAHLQSNRISGIASGIGQDTTVEDGVGRLREMLNGYGTTSSVRARQAEEIRRVIRDSPHPVIVGGDFNDVPSSYIYQRILTPRLRDAWVEGGFGVGTTFDGSLPFLRIDYLLVDTALQILQVDRLNSDFSDHRPLRVRLGK